MVIPTTYAASLFLLFLSLVCFSIWPNLYKLCGSGWRFELFSLDFALGALLAALAAAYTLGTLGPNDSFSDRMLIAGRAASAWIIGAGGILTLGNTVFLASVVLLGLSAATLLTFGTALALTAFLHFRVPHLALVFSGGVLFLLSVAFAVGAGKFRMPGKPKTRWSYRKGIALAVLAGIAFGLFQSVMSPATDPDSGPGPYAALLMLSIGLLLFTPMLDFFFLNIKITGDPISFRYYARGTAKQHALGFIAGLVWAIGALGLLLPLAAAGRSAPKPALSFTLPALAVLVCVLLGVAGWKEFSSSPQTAKTRLAAGAAFFAAGVMLFGLGLTR